MFGKVSNSKVVAALEWSDVHACLLSPWVRIKTIIEELWFAGLWLLLLFVRTLK